MAFIGFGGLTFIGVFMMAMLIGGYVFHKRAKSKYYGALLPVSEVMQICGRLPHPVKIISFDITKSSDLKRGGVVTISLGDGFPEKTFRFPIFTSETDWAGHWKEVYEKAAEKTTSITYSPGAKKLLFLDKSGEALISISSNK